jgi:hypothetical protein
MSFLSYLNNIFTNLQELGLGIKIDILNYMHGEHHNSFTYCKKNSLSCHIDARLKPMIKIQTLYKKVGYLYCGCCYSFKNIIDKYKENIYELQITNISNIQEITNLPNIKYLTIENCKLLESIYNLPSLILIHILRCPLLKKVYNIPNINKQYVAINSCNLLTKFPYFDNHLITKDEIAEIVKFKTIYNYSIYNCKWLKYNKHCSKGILFTYIVNGCDVPLAIRIKKVIIIQRLCRWKAIKKILYKKAPKSVVDFIIRKFYI